MIINQDAVRRSLFNASSYKTYKDEEKKNQTTLDNEKFCKPEKYYPNGGIKTRGMKHGSYDKLDEDGFVKLNSKVGPDDVIIGKVIPSKGAGPNEPKFKDASTTMKANEEGTIDMVYSNKNSEGYRFVKVRVRSEREPELGDKFSSRHGQKGTCGMMMRQEDMPYTKDGIVPDIIMSPAAIPSQ